MYFHVTIHSPISVVESSAYRLIRLNEEVGEREPLIRQANRYTQQNK